MKRTWHSKLMFLMLVVAAILVWIGKLWEIPAFRAN